MANVIATLTHQVILDAHSASKLSNEGRAKLFETATGPATFLPVVHHGLDGRWLSHLFMGQPFEEDMLAGEAVDLVPHEDGSVTATIKLWDTEAGFSAGQRLKQPTGWLHLGVLKNTTGVILLQVNVFNREDVDSGSHS